MAQKASGGQGHTASSRAVHSQFLALPLKLCGLSEQALRQADGSKKGGAAPGRHQPPVHGGLQGTATVVMPQ